MKLNGERIPRVRKSVSFIISRFLKQEQVTADGSMVAEMALICN
jgi:hypothetical protein